MFLFGVDQYLVLHLNFYPFIQAPTKETKQYCTILIVTPVLPVKMLNFVWGKPEQAMKRLIGVTWWKWEGPFLSLVPRLTREPGNEARLSYVTPSNFQRSSLVW